MKGVREVQKKAESKPWAKRVQGMMLKAKFCPAQIGFLGMSMPVSRSKYFKGDSRKVDRERRPSTLERLLARKQKKG